MRALVADAAKVAGMIMGGFARAKPGVDGDAGGAQFGVALPGYQGIGILDRRDDPRNARRDHGIGARRRLADMRTRFERDIQRGAAGSLAGAAERLHLGMRAASGLRPAAPDDDAVLDHDRADRRVRPGAAEAAPSERQGKLHEAPVRFIALPDLLGVLILEDAKDHLRIGASRGSSSPESSPSTASKSLASRKLR